MIWRGLPMANILLLVVLTIQPGFSMHIQV
jgi:hypothetical protein